MVRVAIVSWRPDRLSAALREAGLRHVDLAGRTGLPASSIGSYVAGTSAPTPTGLVLLARGLGVSTTDLAPMSDRPTLHEYCWHAGHSVRSLAKALDISTGYAGTILRGSAPLTDPTAWATVLGVDEQQVLQARREIPRRQGHNGRTCAPPPGDGVPIQASQELIGWHRAVQLLSGSLNPPLSARQREVLLLLCGNSSLTQIADDMGVSLATVRAHIRGVYARMGSRIVSRTTARAAVICHLDPAYLVVRPEMAEQLSARQLEVLTGINVGDRVSVIAEHLGLSQATINRHMKASYAALGVHTQSQALVALFGGPHVSHRLSTPPRSAVCRPTRTPGRWTGPQ